MTDIVPIDIDYTDVLAPGERVTIGDIPRVRIPAGGGTTWELPTGEPARELVGVIVHRQLTRAYWPTGYGEGDTTAPACASPDAVRGYGDPGGDCAACPHAQWGSGRNGGQACRLITHLYIRVDGAPVPWLLVLPPSSAAVVRRYIVGLLASRGVPYWRAVTAITLQRAQTGAIAYSVPVLRTVSILEGADAAEADAEHAAVAGMAAARQTVDVA